MISLDLTDRPRGVQMSIRSGRGELLAPRVVTLVALCVVLPVVALALDGTLAVYTLVMATIYAIAILGGNLVTGLLGEANLAQGGLMAVGAYGSNYLVLHGTPFAFAFAFAVLLGGFAMYLLALPSVRLTGVFTALTTFTLAFAIPDLIVQLEPVTGGGLGQVARPVQVFGAEAAGGSLAMAYLATGTFLVAGLAALLWMHGRLGRLGLSVFGAPTAASVSGMNTRRLAVWIWCIAGCLAGAAGALYAPLVGYISSGQFNLYLSLFLFVGSIVGGSRSVLGAWVGGALVAVIPIYFSEASGGAQPLILGGVLLVCIAIARRGLWPEVERLASGLAAVRVRRAREAMEGSND